MCYACLQVNPVPGSARSLQLLSERPPVLRWRSVDRADDHVRFLEAVRQTILQCAAQYVRGAAIPIDEAPLERSPSATGGKELRQTLGDLLVIRLQQRDRP